LLPKYSGKSPDLKSRYSTTLLQDSEESGPRVISSESAMPEWHRKFAFEKAGRCNRCLGWSEVCGSDESFCGTRGQSDK
jgi:hypothetical protein